MASEIKWNWQQKDWPEFSYDSSGLKALEESFLYNSGLFIGSYRHINDDDKVTFTIDLISDEALKTSEIEDEYLNRDSLQSSIRSNLGLSSDGRKIPLAEQGVSEMMLNLYKDFAAPLTHATLFKWHKMLMKGRSDLNDIGCYRTHDEPMQIISGPLHKPKIHFEAPPSKLMQEEMDKFINWFNETSHTGKKPLPALTRASIAHLYFVSIHPFEDGNGRIGRAIAEKSLAQSMGQPTLIALAQTIQSQRKKYYDNLEQSNKNNLIDSWMEYFAGTILAAQSYTMQMVEFLIDKTRFYDRRKGQLNERQSKVVLRIFKEGIDGFKGGLSAENYISITGTSRATATRDLQDLVAKKAFTKSGRGKGTRYYLNLI